MTHPPVTGGNLNRPMDLAIELAAKAKRDGRRVQINIIHPAAPNALRSPALDQQAANYGNIKIYYVYASAIPPELTHPDYVLIRGMDLDGSHVVNLKECYANARDVYYMPRFMSDKAEDSKMILNLAQAAQYPRSHIAYVRSGFDDESWGVIPSPKEERSAPVTNLPHAKIDLLIQILKNKTNAQNIANLGTRRWGAVYGRGDETFTDFNQSVHHPLRIYFKTLIENLQSRPDLPAPAIFWPRGLFISQQSGEYHMKFNSLKAWIVGYFRLLGLQGQGRELYFFNLNIGTYTYILDSGSELPMPPDFVPGEKDLVLMIGENIEHGHMLKMWDIIGHKTDQGAYSQILPLYTGQGSFMEVIFRGLFGIHDGVLSRIHDSDLSFFFDFARKRLASGEIRSSFDTQTAERIIDVMEAVHYVQQNCRDPNDLLRAIQGNTRHSQILISAMRYLNFKQAQDLAYFAPDLIFNFDQHSFVEQWRIMIGTVMNDISNFLDQNFDVTDRIYKDIFPASLDPLLLQAA